MIGYRWDVKVWTGPNESSRPEEKRDAIRAVTHRCQREFEDLAGQGELRKAMLTVTSDLSMLLTALGAPDPELEAQRIYGLVVDEQAMRPTRRKTLGLEPVWSEIAEDLIARYV